MSHSTESPRSVLDAMKIRSEGLRELLNDQTIDPRRILDGMIAQSEALRALHNVRCRIRRHHSGRAVFDMLAAEFDLRAKRLGLAPDVIGEFTEFAEQAYYSEQETETVR
ncbi:MAG TPA: hypothetical protein VFB54_03640 [Burkholderiales bacterium]|nr:hypothetical protein [Burkholderiales bacterium]